MDGQIVLVPRRIVVIDDDEDTARTFTSLLRELNQHAVAAFDGPSGIELIRQTRAQVVFLDLGMPLMDGFAVARLLRESREFDDLLLVALTGFDQPRDVQSTLVTGFDAHITKPASMEILFETLRRLTPPQTSAPRMRPVPLVSI
jgi:CheY-like chemotaxis protein